MKLLLIHRDGKFDVNYIKYMPNSGINKLGQLVFEFSNEYINSNIVGQVMTLKLDDGVVFKGNLAAVQIVAFNDLVLDIVSEPEIDLLSKINQS